MQHDTVSIKRAAEILNVSPKTLQRWDDVGWLKATDRRGVQKHRYYHWVDLEKFLIKNAESFGRKWALRKHGSKPPALFYCSNSAIFQKKLGDLSEDTKSIHGFESLVAITGEIGNNSFDHNLGNWPDIPGIFFGWNLEKRIVVLADRGQGIMTTLKRVRPTIHGHSEALYIAFTEIVTGRAPEGRGNGLKFVKKIVISQPFKLHFQTGNAILQLQQGDQELNIRKTPRNIIGCFALITF